jgi:hypothetical protein
MRSLTVLFATLLCAACTTDQPIANAFGQVGEFDRTDDTTFTYKDLANVFQPLNTPGGEKVRMVALQRWLSNNDMCRYGFIITERRPIRVTSIIGTTSGYWVHYKGACKV